MNTPNKILNSFSSKNTLNPKFWTNPKDPKKSKMIERVRMRLIQIANQFEDFIGLEIVVEDIQMTGSLSNFNWSDFSDVDLHLIVNFKQFSKNQKDLYKELFNLKKTLFNYEHDIKIFGYDVELYVQDSTEEHTSTGIYSIKQDKWITIPKKEFPKIDKNTLVKKIDSWVIKIDETIEQAEEEKEIKKSLNYLNKLRDKLKNYRKLGLTKDGEFSYENLVFKYLRRNGYIEKLFKFKNKVIDDRLTMKERKMFEQEEKNQTFGQKLLNLFGIGSATGDISSEKQKKEDDPKKADHISSVDDLIKTLESISTPIKQQNRGDYSYQKDVESIQIALQLLGYELPRHGVDGKFGPETANAVEEFKKDNQINETLLKKQINKILKEYVSIISEASFEFDPSGGYSDPTFGLPTGSVGSAKVAPGGLGGDWDGAMPRAVAFAKVANDFMGKNIISSQKRKNRKTASGNVSDHYQGNESAYAVDLACSGKRGDQLLAHLMDWFGYPEYTGGRWLNVTKGGYRYQVGWRVPNHYDHIHVGVKKLGGRVVDTPSSESGGSNSSGIGAVIGSVVSLGMIEKLISLLKNKDISSEDLKKLTDPIITEIPKSDDDFYKSILLGIGAPVTDENMKFLYAWRQAEGGSAKNNPFNTTYKLGKDENMTVYNHAGVKNYSSPLYGIEATIRTLKLSYYTCIVNGLKNDIGATEISRCPALEKWGTGELVQKVVDSYNSGSAIKPKPIPTA